MASLYARYIPPKNNKEVIENIKNDQVQTQQLYARHVPPKIVNSELSKTADAKHAGTKRKRGETERTSVYGSNHNAKDASTGNVDSQQQARSGFKDSQNSTSNETLGHPNGRANAVNDETEVKAPKKTSKKLKRDKKGETVADEMEIDGDVTPRKHSAVMSKFKKSVQTVGGKQESRGEDTDEAEPAPELHDLIPIPIPEQAPGAAPFSALSALPSWLSAPVEISTKTTAQFEELYVDSTLVTILHEKGLKNALPVQAGVLPLLIPTKHQYPGDLCVSAATGSGKTLAYVLPMVQSLRKRATIKLRAVIVVPTRELVNQVRETVELCIAGTELQVGTALGTHAFEAEQEALVKKGRKYDPAGYKAIQDKLARRNMLDDLSDEDVENDISASLADFSANMLPFHVPEYTSKVDILICTPGRFVEHIKSTKGFTLEHLEWFVIDEADRLLDQSFQEWVEIVQKAMLHEPDGRHQNPLSSVPFLARLVEMPPRQPVRKVVLSATMTRDLEKLGSLKLRNPKMIVVQDAATKDVQLGPEADALGVQPGDMNLPTNLIEFGVPVEDGSVKPLFLLKLLQQIFQDQHLTPTSKDRHRRLSVSFSSSSSSTSSSGNDSAESSLSHSDFEDSSSGVSSVLSTSSESSSSDSSSNSDSDSDSDAASTSAQICASTKRPQPPQPPNALIFTSSNESANRLHHLLTDLHPAYTPYLRTLTRSTTSAATQRTLRSFRNSTIRILIATDRASRGLDLPNLTHVINYDVPHSITSYVHRVGRTARAGKDGKAWTLVADREAAWFWNVVGRGKGEERVFRGDRKVERVKVDVGGLGEGIKEKYEEALGKLRDDVMGNGKP